MDIQLGGKLRIFCISSTFLSEVFSSHAIAILVVPQDTSICILACLFFILGSVTTINIHGCLFPTLGAHLATFKTFYHIHGDWISLKPPLMLLLVNKNFERSLCRGTLFPIK